MHQTQWTFWMQEGRKDPLMQVECYILSNLIILIKIPGYFQT